MAPGRTCARSSTAAWATSRPRAATSAARSSEFGTAVSALDRPAITTSNDASWQQGLVVARMRVADALLAQGDFAKGAEAYREAADATQAISDQFPADGGYSATLALARRGQGDALARSGDWQGAIKAYQSALAIEKVVAAKDPTAAFHLGNYADDLRDPRRRAARNEGSDRRSRPVAGRDRPPDAIGRSRSGESRHEKRNSPARSGCMGSRSWRRAKPPWPRKTFKTRIRSGATSSPAIRRTRPGGLAWPRARSAGRPPLGAAATSPARARNSQRRSRRCRA